MGKDVSGGPAINVAALAQQLKAVFSPEARDLAVKRFIAARPDLPQLSEERAISIAALDPVAKRFHGAKMPLFYFPGSVVSSPCADMYGYLTPASVRTATQLPFNLGNQTLLGQLGAFMGSAPPAPGTDSTIPSGFTYFGQFVDHDITLDVSSSLDAATNAETIHNMRSPSLDLDNVYGQGPALDPYLYVFPASGPPSAIKMALGTNQSSGPGGPGGPAGAGGMLAQSNFDVPRVSSSKTAIIGDPRNDENLIVSQFQHAMLKFHNQVVDSLVSVAFAGDIFGEAKRIVTHHYQWVVMHDYLGRICGTAAVNAAMASLNPAVASAFRMPVEFAVGAYRFGHSMIRDRYWLSAAQTNASITDVFNFVRPPNLPVLSNWTVDFNAFFQTGIPVAIFNHARKIDSALAPGLATLPGLSGAMAALATRNLRRGLALGLPSGQGVAGFFGVPALTSAQLTSGLPAAEVNLLNSSGGILLAKTPLWYYCLREAAVLNGGNQLGPVGARIVAETFVRMLKRDANSYVHASPAFTPFLPTLPTTPAGDFTVADLVSFAGVTLP